MEKKKGINYKLLVMIKTPLLLLCIVVGIFFYVKSNPAIREMITLATTVKPETFTELYFENHTKLPSKIELSHLYTFAFTLHNLEYKDMDYPYEVYIEVEGKKQYLDQRTVSIKKNRYKTINENFTFTLPKGRVKVVVNLINKNQQIDFWIESL